MSLWWFRLPSRGRRYLLMRQGHIPQTINSVTYLKVFEVHHLHEVRKRIVNVCGDQQHRLGTLGESGSGQGNLIQWLWPRLCTGTTGNDVPEVEDSSQLFLHRRYRKYLNLQRTTRLLYHWILEEADLNAQQHATDITVLEIDMYIHKLFAYQRRRGKE